MLISGAYLTNDNARKAARKEETDATKDLEHESKVLGHLIMAAGESNGLTDTSRTITLASRRELAIVCSDVLSNHSLMTWLCSVAKAGMANKGGSANGRPSDAIPESLAGMQPSLPPSTTFPPQFVRRGGSDMTANRRQGINDVSPRFCGHSSCTGRVVRL